MIVLVKYGDRHSALIYDAFVQLKLKFEAVLLSRNILLIKSPYVIR